MPNTFLTPDILARRSLANLYELTVMLPLVYRDISSDFGPQKVGNTVNVKRPPRFVATEFDRARGIVIQDTTESKIPVVLDTIADVSVEVTSEELTLDIENFDEQILRPAMEAISQKVDRDLLSLRAQVAQHCGADPMEGGTGRLWENPENLIEAGRQLDIQNVPAPGRRAVVGPTTKARWLGKPLLLHADKSDSTAALRQGSIGQQIVGFDAFWSQNVGQPPLTPVPGQPSTEVGVAFHSTAFAFASAPMELPPGAEVFTVQYKGLSMRVAMDYDIRHKTTVISVDTLYGVKCLDPNRAVLLKGPNATAAPAEQASVPGDLDTAAAVAPATATSKRTAGKDTTKTGAAAA
ncbi:P22 phage major capsid protein family protein [Nocardia sp. NPDC049149]|uniref:P22 phage major capsid protein family protein n=1 Tax=Nocardia sp. NPDC049149 TaxID=3364315 RepID=UPI0037211C0F